MINKLTEISKKKAEKRKNDPNQVEIMNQAAREQAPRFLLISQITRSTQDLQLLQMEQGDSFQATRIPGLPLLPPRDSLFLYAAPASYNSNFPENDGIVITFDKTEHPETIRQTIDSISKHHALNEVPIVSLIVDYEQGDVRLGAHNKKRNYELEIWLLKQVSRPDLVDDRILVIICSDSRVRPPVTPKGVPLAIQTLGGYIPHFTGKDDETAQLDRFFQDWLTENQQEKHIIITAHGAFTGEGASCGAGAASLAPEKLEDKYLNMVITKLADDAEHLEDEPAKNPEERVKSIAKFTKNNLLTYPAITEYLSKIREKEKFIRIALMDTVTNILDGFNE